jgi:hypothetical protein
LVPIFGKDITRTDHTSLWLTRSEYLLTHRQETH